MSLLVGGNSSGCATEGEGTGRNIAFVVNNQILSLSLLIFVIIADLIRGNIKYLVKSLYSLSERVLIITP